jgi:hypothetical protein
MSRPNLNFVMGLRVTIIELLDSTKPKHSNTQMLNWDLFAQLQIGFKFLKLHISTR